MLVVAVPAWLAKVLGMTGGSLWGGLLVVAVYGPFYATVMLSDPTTPAGDEAAWQAGVGWSLAITVLYCAMSAWAVQDHARYNAEIRARADAYRDANSQHAAKVEALIAATRLALNSLVPGGGTTISDEWVAFREARKPLILPPT